MRARRKGEIKGDASARTVIRDLSTCIGGDRVIVNPSPIKLLHMDLAEWYGCGLRLVVDVHVDADMVWMGRDTHQREVYVNHCV